MEKLCVKPETIRLWLQRERLQGSEVHVPPAVTAICFSSSNRWAVQCVVSALICYLKGLSLVISPLERNRMVYILISAVQGPRLSAVLREQQTWRDVAVGLGKRS